MVVSIGGAYVWAQTVADDSPAPDAVLEDSQDRDIPDDVSAIPTFPELGGDPLPDATIIDADGNDVSTASLLGQPLVINFWHSNCPPCAKELADFAAVDEETGDSVRFVGVNPLDSVPVMERFAAERGVEYDLLLDPDVAFQTSLGIAAFPYTLFVTSDGRIIDQTGVVDADGLREKVADLQEMDTQ